MAITANPNYDTLRSMMPREAGGFIGSLQFFHDFTGAGDVYIPYVTALANSVTPGADTIEAFGTKILTGTGTTFLADVIAGNLVSRKVNGRGSLFKFDDLEEFREVDSVDSDLQITLTETHPIHADDNGWTIDDRAQVYVSEVWITMEETVAALNLSYLMAGINGGSKYATPGDANVEDPLLHTLGVTSTAPMLPIVIPVNHSGISIHCTGAQEVHVQALIRAGAQLL